MWKSESSNFQFGRRLSGQMKNSVAKAPMVDRRSPKVARGCIVTTSAAVFTFFIGLAAVFASMKTKFHSGFVLGLLSALAVTVTNCLVLWWPSTPITLLNIILNLVVVPSVLSCFRDLAHTWSDIRKGCKDKVHAYWGTDLECDSARSMVPLTLILFVLLLAALCAMIAGVIYVSFTREKEGLSVSRKLPSPVKTKKNRKKRAQQQQQQQAAEADLEKARGRRHQEEEEEDEESDASSAAASPRPARRHGGSSQESSDFDESIRRAAPSIELA